MKIRLVIPDVNAHPTERPTACRYCGHWRLHRHGTVPKPVRDHQVRQVSVERYKCTGCSRTFRHYPAGVIARDQSQRTVVLAAVLYGLGLSCSASAAFLTAIGVSIARMSVWRDAQAAGEALRRQRPSGSVRVLGADETVFRVWGQPVLVGFMVDDVSGHTISFDLLDGGDAASLLAWLTPYATAMGAEVLVTDGHDAYGVVASALGVEHQLCLAHVRKAVTKQVRSLQTQAADAWGAGERLEQLEDDLATVRDLVRELPEEGAAKLWPVHAHYLGAAPPRKGEAASIDYRMRLLTLHLIETWPKLCLAQARPELGMDGTNNATERAIGKSKLRYKTMRGYKSVDGLRNGIALTQWLYSGDTNHDLGSILAA
jgi:transposase-like protein